MQSRKITLSDLLRDKRHKDTGEASHRPLDSKSTVFNVCTRSFQGPYTVWTALLNAEIPRAIGPLYSA